MSDRIYGTLAALAVAISVSWVVWAFVTLPTQPTPETIEQRCRDTCGKDGICYGACVGSAVSKRNQSGDGFALGIAVGHLIFPK